MSHQGFDSTFKEFKQDFYAKAGDASAFNVLDINLLKVVLDGLKVQYTKRGKVAHYFDQPALKTKLIFRLKIIKSIKQRIALKAKLEKIKNTSFLVAFSDRSVNENGKELPVYFQKLFQTFGRDKFCYMTKGSHKQVGSDLDLSELVFDHTVFSGHNIKLFSALKAWLNSDVMKNMWSSEELENIKIAAHIFYMDYVKLDSFLSQKQFKSALLICHYHNEAFIYACKKHGLQVNELQHGLIAEEDIFYVFPSRVSAIVHKALFPDNILVYGNYWKGILEKGVEYNVAQIKSGGYYQYESAIDKNSTILSSFSGKNIILVTTQYTAEKYFIEYVANISPLLSNDWLICVKPHPAESPELYKSLEQHSNVKVVEGNTNEWIERSEFIITIFSTTIFDAARKAKPAFSLIIPLYSDYTDSLVASGISHPLHLSEDPVLKYNSLDKVRKDGTEFYDEFNKAVVEAVLQ